MGNLTVTDITSIQPYVEAGGNTFKFQKTAWYLRILMILKRSEICSAGIVDRNVRWINRERIANVDVLMLVKTLCLPHPRNMDFSEGR